MRNPSLIACFLALPGCMSILDCNQFAPGSGKALECASAGGDKAAQLELGRRLEEGDGMPVDLARAAAMYRAAATFTSGTTFAYLPPVGGARFGSTIPVRTGQDQAGLPEAKYRLGLMHLSGRGVRFDLARGLQLLREAADAGFAPAADKLHEMQNAPRS